MWMEILVTMMMKLMTVSKRIVSISFMIFRIICKVPLLDSKGTFCFFLKLLLSPKFFINRLTYGWYLQEMSVLGLSMLLPR